MKNYLTALRYPVENFSSAASFAHYNIRRKYSGTWLGIIWSVILPLCNALVLSFVFYFGFKFAGVSLSQEYLWRVLSGYFIWLAITNTMLISATSAVTNSGLLKQISFNRHLLPVSVVFEALALNTLPLLLLPFFTQNNFLGLIGSVILIFCSVFLIAMLLIGLASILTIGGKKVRDLHLILTPLVTVGIYLLPIYIPNWQDVPQLQFIILLNPFTPFIFLIQAAVLNDFHNFYAVLPQAIFTAFFVWVAGVFFYHKNSTSLGDGI